MRNKMIELLFEVIAVKPAETLNDIAEYLLANGVTIIPECKGCVYANRKRPQKCSCCRRNKDMADLFKPEPPKENEHDRT